MAEMDVRREAAEKYHVNPFLWVIPLVLSGIGILMITSTTSPNSFILTGTPFQMGIKQLKWLIFAVVCMMLVYMIPLRFWFKYSAPLLITTWFMAWLPLLPGIGASIGGARRWIRLPGLSVSLHPAARTARIRMQKAMIRNMAFHRCMVRILPDVYL